MAKSIRAWNVPSAISSALALAWTNHSPRFRFASAPDGKGRNCYWPMPFRKKARITVTNESDKRCDCFYYYIDWQKHDSLPEDTAYFHAMYRREFPCTMGRNYLIADIEGRGHYVGTIKASIMLHRAGGEGDVSFSLMAKRPACAYRHGGLFLRWLGFSRTSRTVLWNAVVGGIQHGRPGLGPSVSSS